MTDIDIEALTAELRELLRSLDAAKLTDNGVVVSRDNLSALLSEITRLRAALVLPQAGGWIACAERMPDPEQEVVVYAPNRLKVFEAFYVRHFAATHRWQYGGGRYCAEDIVTHWQPLPAPPGESR
jgi:hypothetical protein